MIDHAITHEYVARIRQRMLIERNGLVGYGRVHVGETLEEHDHETAWQCKCGEEFGSEEQAASHLREHRQ